MMTLADIRTDFDTTLETWQKALHHYRDPQLKAQLEPEGWTLGQLYRHVLDSTHLYYLQQVDHCVGKATHQQEGKTDLGTLVFAANQLSEVSIYVPPTPQYVPDQPAGRAELIATLEETGMLVGLLLHRIGEAQPKGKQQHPRLGYLDATEWLQLVAMHWRYYLGEKSRLDALLPSVKG